MKIGMVLGGIAMAGIGVATALYLPAFLEKDAAEFAASSNAVFDAKAATSAKDGDKFLFHGTISADNKTFEKDLVIGTKWVWKKKDRKAAKRAASRDDKLRAEAGWRTVEEYRQVLTIDLDTGAKAKVMLDELRIEGTQEKTEEKVDGEKYQWTGLKAGTEVSFRGEISMLDPLSIDQTRGQSLHVGKPPAEVVASDADSAASVSKGVLYGGIGFAGIGGLVLIFGVIGRAKS